MTIAEMYFRINTDARQYHKSEYGLINLLGDVGGVELLLTQIFLCLFGGFIHFNGFVNTLDNLEIPEHVDPKNTNPLGLDMMAKIKKDLQTKYKSQEIQDIMELGLYERVKIYMML